MNEKSLKVLEQYEIQVTGTRRGRGSYICETNMGKKLLADYVGSEKKLAFVNQVLEELRRQGYPFTDIVMANNEGNLISKDWEENGYILKDWYEGKECDTRNTVDMEYAVQMLAELHQKMVFLPEEGVEIQNYTGEHLVEELQRHNRELRKIYAFVKKRQRKNEFEVQFLNCFPMFYEQAQEAEKRAAASGYEQLRKENLRKGCLCHGSYHQHNIYFLGRRQIFVSNFEKCRYDVQAADLYQFLRKMMEKQDFDPRVGDLLLESYDRIRHLNKDEWDYIAVRMYYPEKFWKLANQYYNRGKVWIPWKSAGKLETLIRQQNQRNDFLKTLE